MQCEVTTLNSPQNVDYAVLPNSVISETKHTIVQTNGACNVNETCTCLIQAVRIAMRLILSHLSPFSVYIFAFLNSSTNTCPFVQLHDMNELN